MKNKVAEGGLEDWTNDTSADVVSGEVVGPLGTASRFGVAVQDIADTKQGVLATEGNFELAAASADAWDHGDILYWDVADGNLTDDADTGTNKRIGVAVGDKAATVTKAVVDLNA